MRKFWPIGLVMLVALAACGDKKAEQATALKQEVQDLLAKAAGSGDKKIISFGEVAVAPDGDAFAVTIDKFAVTAPDAAPLDLGKIGFKLTPDGDDIRKFSDLSLPAAVSFKGTDGKETLKLALALDHGNGSWSKKLGQMLTADVLLKNLEVTQPSSGDKMIASDVAYQLQTKDNGQGVFDQEASIGSKLMSISDKDGQVAIADLKGSSNVGGAKLTELMALKGEWQKATASEKPGQLLPLLTKTFQLFKSMKFAVSTGQFTASTGGTTVFSLGGFGFDFGMEDVDQPKVKLGSSLRYAGLAIPSLGDLVGGLGAEVLPTDFSMALNVADMPLAKILDAWAKTMPDADVTDENAMMGTSMMAAGIAMQAIQEAAVKINLTDGKLKAPGLTGSFSGVLDNDPKAAMGFTGTANVELSDLDALIAKGQQFADQPQTQEILGTLQMMRGLSERGTDAAGKPTDKFKITVDAAGNTLVNGKSLMPPEAPPSDGSGSSGDGSSGSGTTTSP
jgi:hypothetical protein